MVCIFFGRCDCHSGITFYLVVVMVKIYHRDSKKLIEEKEYQEELVLCQDLVQVKMRNFFPF